MHISYYTLDWFLYDEEKSFQCLAHNPFIGIRHKYFGAEHRFHRSLIKVTTVNQSNITLRNV